MAKTCTGCSAELVDGSTHFCARTKEPKARELAHELAVCKAEWLAHDKRIEALESNSAGFWYKTEPKTFDLGAHDDNGVRSKLSDDDLRLAIACWEAHRESTGQVYVEFVTKSERRADGSLVQDCLRISPRNILNELLNLRAANHENTGAALGDGSERQPSDSHGSPAPDKGGCGTKHGEPSTQALGELRSVEACGKAPVTVDLYKLTDEEREALAAHAHAQHWTNPASNGHAAWMKLVSHIESLVTRAVRRERELVVERLRGMASEVQSQRYCTAERAITDAANTLAIEHGGGLERNATPREGRCPSPAASALPMPERPVSWLSESIDGQLFIEGDAFYKMRDRCVALESRLAEGEKHRDHLLSLLRHSASRGERLLADRDALKAKLAEAVAVAGDAIGTDPTQRSTGCVDALAGHYRIVCEDRDALRAKLEASEYEVRRLQVVANEDRAVSDAIRGERERLRAKLDAMSSGIANEQRSRHGLERRVTELEAKLDGVREAAEKWEMTQEAFEMYNGGRTVKASLDRVGRFAIKSALAAAENTNTGAVAQREQAVEPLVAGSTPASTHPSHATAFEMTLEQRGDLGRLVNAYACVNGYPRAEWESISSWTESLVRSELRKAREGWVTREVAECALEQCAIEYISGSSVHANAKDYLTAAIRAASKEASDGTR